MKRYTMFVALLAFASTLAWSAEDGAALFKAKCAGCHGAAGEGKPAMKAPALKGTKLSESDISGLLTKGAADKKMPHSKAVPGLTADQATAVAGYVKSLK
jgi:mono/diheme cytochrome c family protein